MGDWRPGGNLASSQKLTLICMQEWKANIINDFVLTTIEVHSLLLFLILYAFVISFTRFH